MKFFLLLMLSITTQSKANILQFNPGDPISASSMNQNFNYLNSQLDSKQIHINFPVIQPGNESLLINQHFELLENLGINLVGFPFISGSFIKSSEVNLVFNSATNNISAFENTPIIIQAPYNQLFQTQIIVPELSSGATYSLFSSAQKGSASISNSGMLSYTSPAQSFDYTQDYLYIQVSDSNYTIIKRIDIDIIGSGIILNGTARTYYDGTIAKTCNEYFTQSVQKYTYTGNVGSGFYKIKPNNNVIEANCDMVNNGGGWTQITDSTPTLAELSLWGDTSSISATFNVNASYGFNFGPTVDDSVWTAGLYKYEVPIPHASVRVTYTGFYNNPTGGLGVLQLGNDISLNDYIYFVDPYTNDTRGQTLVVDGSVLFQADTAAGRTNITNRTDIVVAPNPQSKVSVAMNAYINLPNTYPYTRRYIRELWVK